MDAAVSQCQRLLVLFGLPGAGKTFAARRLSRHGFHVHDGDADLPDDMRQAIARALPVSADMRDRFMAALRESVAALWLRHPELAVAQTFLKQAHRTAFAERFPGAEFVLVTAGARLRAARLAARRSGRLDPRYARAMTKSFDPPEPPYHRLRNDGDGRDLDRQLAAIISRRGSE